MNWVNSSLQLAGTLLESVDQRAALTLTNNSTGSDGEDEGDGTDDADEGILSSFKKGITRAKETARGSQYEDEHAAISGGSGGASSSTEVPRSSGGSFMSSKLDIAVRSPPGSTSSAKSARHTPPHSGNGRPRIPQSPSPVSSSDGMTSSASTSSLSLSPSSTDAEWTRLKKENAKLKSDLRLRDKTIATHQQSVQVYEDEIEALERECTNKLADAQSAMGQLRMEKDADEKNFIQALELKDSQLQKITADYRALQEVDAHHVDEMDQLRAEITRSEDLKDSLWTNASSASQQSEQVVTSLRVELQQAQTSLSQAKREFGDAKLMMYERQSQLETTNAELSNSVATLEKELAKTKEQLALSAASSAMHGSASTSVASGGSLAATHMQLQEEYRKVQQTLVITKKTLHEETRKCEIQRQEVLSLADEIKRLKEVQAVTQNETSKQVITLTKANAALQEKLAYWETNSVHKSATTHHSTEARIQTLTNRLIEKQESIDVLRSKATTLEVRLNDAQSRSATAEAKLAQIERNGGVVAMDMEMGTPVGRKLGARSRSNRMANAITRVAPVVERSARVVSALDVLDKWLLFLGRLFLSVPLARLGSLCYVLLIHFWVFVVLSFHTSHLNQELHEGAGGAGRAPAQGGMFPDGMQVPP